MRWLAVRPLGRESPRLLLLPDTDGEEERWLGRISSGSPAMEVEVEEVERGPWLLLLGSDGGAGSRLRRQTRSSNNTHHQD